MDTKYTPLVISLGVSGANIVLMQHIDHAVAGIQHRIGKVGDGQGDGGKDQMLGNIAVIRPAGALGRRIRTAGRQQLQLKGKNVQQ